MSFTLLGSNDCYYFCRYLYQGIFYVDEKRIDGFECINESRIYTEQKRHIYTNRPIVDIVTNKVDAKTDDNVWLALDISQCSEFVSDEKGTDKTWIYDPEPEFSGGQEGRIEIARTVYDILVSEPKVLLLDEIVKHCTAMWQSAISNHKDVSKFCINNLKKSRTRKNLPICPESCSKKVNAIFVKALGEMKSNIPLSNIQKISVLQYNKHNNSFNIIVPYNETINRTLYRHDKCGIDIGCRTFLTTWSKDESMEIGTSDKTYKMMQKYFNKLDKINCYENCTVIKKARQKYYKKLKDRITDMHCKVSSMLCKRYNDIIIGKVSTKKMISNSGTLFDITKRRLITLSHYKFREKLEHMCAKYSCNLYYTDEYMTSKMCSNCGNIKENLGSNKVYCCNFCNLKVDRDINAAINIHNIE